MNKKLLAKPIIKEIYAQIKNRIKKDLFTCPTWQ